MSKKTKKIAFITGTRADFGIVTPLLQKIDQHPFFTLQLYATGMHLLPKFGSTLHTVQAEFPQAQKIPVTFSDHTPAGVVRFGGALLTELATIFSKDRPDVVLVHGDRIEMLMVATAASYFHIPVIHTQGGDLSETIDNKVRHTLSKMADLHFVATQEARRVLLHLGEEPWRIKVLGTLALDSLLHQKLKTKAEVSTYLKLPTTADFILVTLHPISEDVDAAGKQMKVVLAAALKTQLPMVVIYPNADPGSEQMIQEIEKVRHHKNVQIFQSIPYSTFLSLEKHAKVWIGNSSAGIVDSPSFRTPVVNVGPRQAGRVRSVNIIDVDYNERDISAAIKKAMTDKSFLKKVHNVISPWGKGRTSDRIIHLLERLEIDEKLLSKKTRSI